MPHQTIDILPAPFDWVAISAGKVTLQTFEKTEKPRKYNIPGF